MPRYNPGRGTGFAGNVSGSGAAKLGVDIAFSPTPMVLARDFQSLGENIRSLREPLKRAIQKIVSPSIAMNFKVGGRPDAWEELSAATALRRKHKGYNELEPILVRTGNLAKVAAQLNLWTIDGDLQSASAYIGSIPERAWYGAAHQQGYVSSEVAVPARPWAMIQDEDVPQIEYIFEDWLAERVAAAGFRRGLA